MKLLGTFAIAVVVGLLAGLLSDTATAQDKVIGIGYQKHSNRFC